MNTDTDVSIVFRVDHSNAGFNWRRAHGISAIGEVIPTAALGIDPTDVTPGQTAGDADCG
jgi:hypothetical protein